MWYSLLYFGRDEIFFLFIQLTRVPVNLHKRIFIEVQLNPTCLYRVWLYCSTIRNTPVRTVVPVIGRATADKLAGIISRYSIRSRWLFEAHWRPQVHNTSGESRRVDIVYKHNASYKPNDESRRPVPRLKFRYAKLLYIIFHAWKLDFFLIKKLFCAFFRIFSKRIVHFI